MRPARRRPTAQRAARFEACEPRVVLSSSPASSLATQCAVVGETLDNCLQTLSTSAVPAAGASDDASLTRLRSQYGLDGAGQTVAVIDSGIAYTDAALGGGYGSGYRVVGGYDFTGDAPNNPYDFGPNGSHGTHVAGIVGSSNALHPGVAPDVDLVSLRVFNNAGNSSFTWVDQALQWVHQHRNDYQWPITTVNLSLGINYNGETPPQNAQLEKDLAQLSSDGIFVTAAAGNNYTSYNTIGVTYPAASPYVTPVEALNAPGQLASFSQRDSRALAAPGVSILSTVPDYMGNHNGVDDDFARYSGTSMAAPYVAGAAVLVREAYAKEGVNHVSAQTLYQTLYNTADTFVDPGTGLTVHSVDIGRAVQFVMQGSKPAAAPALDTPGVYNAASGVFSLKNTAASGNADTTLTSSTGMIAIAGDWNGDGTVTTGVYDPRTSTFYLKNANASGNADLTFQFGTAGAGWLPVVGDWNGDGTTTVGLYDPTRSVFHLRNSNTAGGDDLTLTFGVAHAGWLPVAGDWTGSHVATIGLYDPSHSTFYLKYSNSGGYADAAFAYGAANAGWKPVAGDWNQDGRETVGLYDPTHATFYLRNSNSSGYADLAFQFGAAGSQAVVGDWTNHGKLSAKTVSSAAAAAVRAQAVTTLSSSLLTAESIGGTTYAASPLPSPALQSLQVQTGSPSGDVRTADDMLAHVDRLLTLAAEDATPLPSTAVATLGAEQRAALGTLVGELSAADRLSDADLQRLSEIGQAPAGGTQASDTSDAVFAAQPAFHPASTWIEGAG